MNDFFSSRFDNTCGVSVAQSKNITFANSTNPFKPFLGLTGKEVEIALLERYLVLNEAVRIKSCWSQALDRLKETVEDRPT